MISDLQFSAVSQMTILALSLATLLPKKVSEDKITNRSRWLIVSGLVVLAVQFLIQYIGGYRKMGVIQAVLFNILFFIPASALFSLSFLNLQRQGNITKFEWFIAIPTWLLALSVILWALITDGAKFPAISERLKWAEVIGTSIYGAMQCYYGYLIIKEIRRTRLALDNYFDFERGMLVDWMQQSIIMLTILALLAPLLIFMSGWPFTIYSIILFLCIFYTWFCFIRYVITNEAKHVRDANQNAVEEEIEKKEMKSGKLLTIETVDKVGRAVEEWLASGGHLKSGITSPVAATEMGIPRYQLTAWVKSMGHNSFTHWIMNLRIEEAKRVLLEHKNWSNEAVADHCGFTRTHFQRTFKNVTGMSPNEYILTHKNDNNKPI